MVGIVSALAGTSQVLDAKHKEDAQDPLPHQIDGEGNPLAGPEVLKDHNIHHRRR